MKFPDFARDLYHIKQKSETVFQKLVDSPPTREVSSPRVSVRSRRQLHASFRCDFYSHRQARSVLCCGPVFVKEIDIIESPDQENARNQEQSAVNDERRGFMKGAAAAAGVLGTVGFPSIPGIVEPPIHTDPCGSGYSTILRTARMSDCAANTCLIRGRIDASYGGAMIWFFHVTPKPEQIEYNAYRDFA